MLGVGKLKYKFSSNLNNIYYTSKLDTFISRSNVSDDVTYAIPWQSTNIPPALKNTDYFNVTGENNEYKLNKGIKVRLLPRQGAWGKVYTIQQDKLKDKQITLAVIKLLQTRNDNNKEIEDYRRRHKIEIQNNFKVINSDIKFACKVYAINKISEDLYQIVMEYGDNLLKLIKKYSIDNYLEQIYKVMNNIEEFHKRGYAHGDLKLDNMILTNNKIKLIDWYSFRELGNTLVSSYRYDGDELPPEAIKALYYKEDKSLKYAKADNDEFFMLHPIAADRFCLGMSLLAVLEPDLYSRYYSIFPKEFNFWKPKSIDIVDTQIKHLIMLQKELRIICESERNYKKRNLILQVAEFIDVNPLKRKFILLPG